MIKEMLARYGELNETERTIEDEIAALMIAKAGIRAEKEQIEETLKIEMQGAGKSRATIYGWKLNISQSVSTIVEEPDILPDAFWKIERKPDLKQIKENIKEGLYVPGAVLQTNTNINIKKA